jgi:hypothetical protein
VQMQREAVSVIQMLWQLCREPGIQPKPDSNLDERRGPEDDNACGVHVFLELFEKG